MSDTHPYKIQAVLISGNKWKTEFMQRADMFEQFKVLGTPEVLEISAATPFDDDYLAKFIAYIVDASTKKGDIVSACFVKGRAAGAYRNPAVKAVSNGSKWATLDVVLKAYDYVPTTNVQEVS